ncbi:hypothetical protein SAMN05660226_00309 [Parapedobacter luteus]|uniref:N-acetyltransferase domain-containing protein n=2 Tax=Sphingobacteriaceae TaxID=84566 RepID=A0A1T4ZYX8_9SPHI|nr:hypothetical protein SAMN05660226_00309 [Parapedobacter luteus]
MPHRATADTEGSDDGHQLRGSGIMLKVLTSADADAFFNLHVRSADDTGCRRQLIRNDDTSETFAQRIVSTYEMVWTIRPENYPDTIIGDCAIRYRDKTSNNELAFEGSLIPAYQHQGIMTTAFSIIARFVKEHYAGGNLPFPLSR